MACFLYHISGRVQGVWFRQSTVDEARRYGLRGYARNLPDGRVEVLACGDAQGLAALEAWLQHGPPMARVDDVTKVAADDPGMSDFRIVR